MPGAARSAIAFGGGIFLHNRGLTVPAPLFGAGSQYVVAALALAIVGALAYRALGAAPSSARRGRRSRWRSSLFCSSLPSPLAVYFAAGRPIGFDYPQLRGFNFVGGLRVLPEFVALWSSVSRSIRRLSSPRSCVPAFCRFRKGRARRPPRSVSTAPQILKLVVMPQAMRVIIPPLTNQYLNLTKNSSLAVFIGYPDLVQVFAGTVLNQTGAAVQVIAMTMAVYLAISLVTSLGMDLYNRRMALEER